MKRNNKYIGTAVMVPTQGVSKISPFESGSIEGNMRWLVENGFSGIEPVIYNPISFHVAEFRKMTEEYNLAVTTIVTGQSGELEEASLSIDDEWIRNKTIRKMKAYIGIGSELNSMVTVGLVKGTCTKATKDAAVSRLTKSMNELVEYAEHLGVTLLMEPINQMKSGFLNSSQEVCEYMHQYFEGAPVRLLWDSFQSELEDDSVIESLDAVKGCLGHVHFADTDRLFPGEGKIDFEGIFRKLVENQYKGYITLECYNIPSNEHILEKAKGLFGYLENTLLSK